MRDRYVPAKLALVPRLPAATGAAADDFLTEHVAIYVQAGDRGPYGVVDTKHLPCRQAVLSELQHLHMPVITYEDHYLHPAADGQTQPGCGDWRLLVFSGDYRMPQFAHVETGGRRWKVVFGSLRYGLDPRGVPYGVCRIVETGI